MTCPVDSRQNPCPFEQANRQGICTACGFDPTVHVPDQGSRESYLAHCRDRLHSWTPPTSGPSPHEVMMREVREMREMREMLARVDALKAQLARERDEVRMGLSQRHLPETDEALMAGGQWRDPKTHMIWMRCSLGQTWDGTTCVGEAKQYAWEEAKQAVADLNASGGFGGHRDWELPHIEDLHSLIYCPAGFQGSKEIPTKSSCTKTAGLWRPADSETPPIDTAVFPNMPMGDQYEFCGCWFWSSSPYALDGNCAWMVGFDEGYTGFNYKDTHYYVRVVRSGQ